MNLTTLDLSENGLSGDDINGLLDRKQTNKELKILNVVGECLQLPRSFFYGGGAPFGGGARCLWWDRTKRNANPAAEMPPRSFWRE